MPPCMRRPTVLPKETSADRPLASSPSTTSVCTAPLRAPRPRRKAGSPWGSRTVAAARAARRPRRRRAGQNECGSYANDTRCRAHAEQALVARGVDGPPFTADGPEDAMLRAGAVPGRHAPAPLPTDRPARRRGVTTWPPPTAHQLRLLGRRPHRIPPHRHQLRLRRDPSARPANSAPSRTRPQGHRPVRAAPRPSSSACWSGTGGGQLRAAPQRPQGHLARCPPRTSTPVRGEIGRCR